MADWNVLCTHVMYGFETQELAEARGTCMPSTNPKESRKRQWAGD